MKSLFLKNILSILKLIKKISFNNMKNCFNFIGMDPMDFGYEYPNEEEI